MILAVVVHPAHIQDRDGAKQVLTLLQGRFPRLQRIWADGNYAGELIPWVFTFGEMPFPSGPVPGNSLAAGTCSSEYQ